MWQLFQGLVFFAVASASIYWEWTPNGLLVGLMGAGAAWLATKALSGLIDVYGWFRRVRARSPRERDQAPGTRPLS